MARMLTIPVSLRQRLLLAGAAIALSAGAAQAQYYAVSPYGGYYRGYDRGYDADTYYDDYAPRPRGYIGVRPRSYVNEPEITPREAVRIVAREGYSQVGRPVLVGNAYRIEAVDSRGYRFAVRVDAYRGEVIDGQMLGRAEPVPPRQAKLNPPLREPGLPLDSQPPVAPVPPKATPVIPKAELPKREPPLAKVPDAGTRDAPRIIAIPPETKGKVAPLPPPQAVAPRAVPAKPEPPVATVPDVKALPPAPEPQKVVPPPPPQASTPVPPPQIEKKPEPPVAVVPPAPKIEAAPQMPASPVAPPPTLTSPEAAKQPDVKPEPPVAAVPPKLEPAPQPVVKVAPPAPQPVAPPEAKKPEPPVAAVPAEPEKFVPPQPPVKLTPPAPKPAAAPQAKQPDAKPEAPIAAAPGKVGTGTAQAPRKIEIMPPAMLDDAPRRPSSPLINTPTP